MSRDEIDKLFSKVIAGDTADCWQTSATASDTRTPLSLDELVKLADSIPKLPPVDDSQCGACGMTRVLLTPLYYGNGPISSLLIAYLCPTCYAELRRVVSAAEQNKAQEG
jgi:hypothetical protein